jgi:hypothetical protein
MKRLILIALTVFVGITSCNDDFLNEKPLTFLAPENIYTTDNGLSAGALGLYDIYIAPYSTNGQFEKVYCLLFGATDIFRAGYAPTPTVFFLHNDNYSPTQDFLQVLWDDYYQLANNAAIIIDRSAVHEWESSTLKKQTIGEAHFFRAFAHFYLSQLWGPIPLISEEGVGVRLDYKRNSKDEIIKLIEHDLKTAEENLSYDEFEGQAGRITKGAAQHLLAYAYLAFKQYENAEVYARKVIDSGHYELMVQRFGSRKDDPQGNVFWDLFQLGNQNRSSGNKEGILIIQNEDINTFPTVGYRDSDAGSFKHNRHLYPNYWNIKGLAISGEYGGRGIGRQAVTLHWLDSFTPADIRGKMPCVQRVFLYNDPNNLPVGKALGDTIFDFDQPGKFSSYGRDELRLRPYPTKWNWNEGDTPDNGTFIKDIYLFRFSETYLILAEALLMQNNKKDAAKYINLVRRRSGAPDITSADVSIDFILDERGRELWGEVPRRVDLYRTDKFIERTRLYNPHTGPGVKDKHALLPIPQGEIDLNTESPLEQNPGW